jgi:site-specific recombinase XerD
MEITRTAYVVVRHSHDCPDKAKGPSWHRCKCRKGIRFYQGGGSGSNRYKSAKTRSWEAAEKFCQAWLDQFDPVKRELAELKAVKEKQSVTVAAAIVSFIKDMRFRLGDTATVKQAEGMFAYVDGDTICRQGQFSAWADRQAIQYVCDITPAHLMAWRNSWTCGDLTAYIRWSGVVSAFFKFCVAQDWIKDSPARGLHRPKFKRGSRTGIFTDQQYAAILEASHGDRLLETFLELLRWSGMAIVDAVQFQSTQIDSDGVLTYRRQKTSQLATIPLPEHVLALLRLAGSGQPFRVNSIREWRRQLQALFAKAGVKKVITEVGARKAHPHMLRDTFAVSALRQGCKLHTVSKMLGHSKTTITEQCYLPWVKELKDAHVDDARKSLEAAKPKAAGTVTSIRRA